MNADQTAPTQSALSTCDQPTAPGAGLMTPPHMKNAAQPDLIPVRALNQVSYCARLYYLEYVEAMRDRGRAEDLAQDMPTCERPLAQIQLIDVAAQRLAALAAIST